MSRFAERVERIPEPEEKWYRLAEVVAQTGKSRSWLLTLIKRHDFPVVVGREGQHPRRTVWVPGWVYMRLKVLTRPGAR